MNDNYEATMFRGGFGQLYLDGWEQGLIRKIVRELQMGGSPTALDLGAGEGRMSALMSKLGYSVVSVDRSKRACKSLSRRSRSECFSVVLSDMTC
jgi:16S rRNA A1518/A1519 N6-dimethyltransferase RsmA/KsgA/DIM1 with predicted DNA glycosylase/AP lyase activity